jgi:hypothetical protein
VSKPAKALLLLLALALLPLRSMALMENSCGFGQEQTTAVQSAAGAQDSHAGPGHAGTHCSSATFLSAAVPAALAAGAQERGPALLPRAGPVFFPDNLDRPPLASLR